MADLLTTTIDGSVNEKSFGSTGIITKQANLNSDVIFSCANHGLVANQPIVFTASTGTNSGGNALLPANIIAGTTYYVRPGWSGGAQHILTGVDNNFQVSTTPGGTEILWGSGFQGSVASPGHTYSAKNILHSTSQTIVPQIGNILTGAQSFSTNTVSRVNIVYDVNADKIVVAYRDDTDAGKGKAVVGTVSSTTIVWGTPVQFSTGETTAAAGGNVSQLGFAMDYHTVAQKVVIAWSEGDVNATPGKGTSKVGTVSGTGTSATISFGSEGIFETSNYALTYMDKFSSNMVYDSNAQKMVITWRGYGGTATGTSPGMQAWAAVGTVTGTSISWGTPVLAAAAGTYGTTSSGAEFRYTAIAYDTASQNFVIVWEGQHVSAGAGFGSESFARVGTVTGTSITFGPVNTHMKYDNPGSNLADADWGALSYDTAAQKILFCYSDYSTEYGQSRTGTARVGHVSGSGATAAIAFGKPITYSGDVAGTASNPGGTDLHPAKGTELSYNSDRQNHLLHYVHYVSNDPAATYLHQLARTATITAVTLTCTTTNSSTTVTTASTSSLAVGMSITGTGMGAGTDPTTATTIASITNATTFVLSAAATASGSTSLIFTSISFSDQVSINTSGGSYQVKLAYDSVDNKMVFIRCSSGAASATMINFDANSIILDLAIGNFFEVDLGNLTEPISTITINNSSATHVSSFALKITQGYEPKDFNWSELTAFKWEAGTAPTLTTSNNKIDILSFITYDNGTTWHGSVVGQNYTHLPEAVPSNLFGDRGVFGGHDHATRADIEYINISTMGNAVLFGDLTTARQAVSGLSDSSRGIFCGGTNMSGTTGETDTMEYITISTPGNVTDFGNLIDATEYPLGAASDGSRGVIAGGEAGSLVRKIGIVYITIATPGNATVFGNLTAIRARGDSCSDGTRAVFAGGYDAGGANSVTTLIEYITIATLGNGTIFGNLGTARGHLAGTSDAHRGVFSGGGSLEHMEYINISTLGNSLVFGALIAYNRYLAATSNGSRGIIGGGYPANTGRIEYFAISTPADSKLFGYLTQARDSGTGFSGN